MEEVNLGSIQKGMEVYDTSGTKIGSVSDVLTVEATSQDDVTGHAMTATDRGTLIKIHKGGLMGLGGTDLYVPLSGIDSMVPGDCLTLNCASDQADSLYGSKPDFLS